MKILYLTARQPFPVIKGDQIIAYEQIKELSKKNEIYLVSFYESDKNLLNVELKKYCKEIHLIKDNKIKKVFSMLKTFYNFKSIQANSFYRYSVDKKVKKIYERIKPDIVQVQSFRMAEYFVNERVNKSIDLIDAYSLNMKKRADNSKYPIKLLWLIEYYLLYKYEKTIMLKYDKKTIVSQRDKDFLNDNNILVNPNGTSIDFNKVKQYKIKNTIHNNHLNIIFQGNMSFFPNVEAVKYIVKQLLPKIKQKYGYVKLYIVGGRPCNEVLKFNNNDDIIVTGYVKDMEEYLAKADIAIYPIFSATGMQNKILEAMAAKVPCIVTKYCVQGIKELKHMENVLVAKDNEEFIEYVDKIKNNQELEDYITSSGYYLIKDNYSWERNCKRLQNYWEKQ